MESSADHTFTPALAGPYSVPVGGSTGWNFVFGVVQVCFAEHFEVMGIPTLPQQHPLGRFGLGSRDMAQSLAGLRDLVASRKVAALGTLHDGAPYVSMVPFALLQDGSAFVIHVSGLSAHTADMLADPRVSLLILEPENDRDPAQALARITILGEALPIDASSDLYAVAKNRYLERFPDAAPIFELGGFSLFAITPTALRWIGGFAAARSLSPEAFAEAVRGEARGQS